MKNVLTCVANCGIMLIGGGDMNIMHCLIVLQGIQAAQAAGLLSQGTSWGLQNEIIALWLRGAK